MQAQSFLRGPGFNAALKESLQDTALFWHSKFSKIHFTRRAYELYPAAYPNQKKRGRPFFVSGHFMQVIGEQGTRQNVSGTANKVKLIMQMGRPAKYTPNKIRSMIFGLMRAKNISYKAAERRIYSNLGYSAEVKNLFIMGIPAVSPAEEKTMREFLASRLRERSTAALAGAMRGRAAAADEALRATGARMGGQGNVGALASGV